MLRDAAVPGKVCCLSTPLIGVGLALRLLRSRFLSTRLQQFYQFLDARPGGHLAGRHPEYPGSVDRRKQEVQLASIAECIVTVNENTGPEGFSELQRACCRSHGCCPLIS